MHSSAVIGLAGLARSAALLPPRLERDPGRPVAHSRHTIAGRTP